MEIIPKPKTLDQGFLVKKRIPCLFYRRRVFLLTNRIWNVDHRGHEVNVGWIKGEGRLLNTDMGDMGHIFNPVRYEANDLALVPGHRTVPLSCRFTNQRHVSWMGQKSVSRNPRSYLFTRLSGCLYARMSVHLSVRPPNWLPECPPPTPIHSSIHASVRPSLYSPISLPPSIHSPIRPPVYPSTQIHKIFFPGKGFLSTTISHEIKPVSSKSLCINS